MRSTSGSLIRVVGNGDAVNAELSRDGKLVLITTNQGKVEIRQETGSLIRTIGNGDAVNAKFHENDIMVYTKSGKMELRKDHGSLIRVL